MNNKITFKIKLPILGKFKIRLDKALTVFLPQYSRSLLKNWILNNQVLIDGCVVNKPSIMLKGTFITVLIIEKKLVCEPENIYLDIVYEDECLLVINKPSGLVVHPGFGNLTGTILNGLIYRMQKSTLIPRAGIIHRLDKDTTGLLVIAKNLYTYVYLVEQLKLRKIVREYLTIVKGVLFHDGSIFKSIARHPIKRTKMTVSNLGKKAITHYKIFQKFKQYTYLKVFLETGRTHQIRVHMSHINHPIVGDSTYCGTYSNKKKFINNTYISNFNRQALHATTIQLIHPITRKLMKWTVPIPNDMRQLLKSIITITLNN